MHYFKDKYILFFVAALTIFFFSTAKVLAKSFQINDIEISKPFENNFDKNKVIDIGFKNAFSELMQILLKSSDYEKMNKIRLNEIKSMVESFSIKEEKFIDEIYYLNLNVSFNKKKIFNLLEKKNIFPSLPIKKNIFFIPIIIDEDKDEILMFSENYLFNNWNLNKKKYHLLNYILPTEDLEDFNLVKSKSKNLENYDFQEIINKYNLEDYIIMIIFKNNQEIKIINKINFNKTMDLKNLKFKNLKFNNDKVINEFIENFKTLYENYWKIKNEINTSVKLPLIVSVDNKENSKISKFEKKLANIDLIYDFYILKFNNKNNIYKIIFNGSPDKFLKIMNKNNYEFDIQNQIWALR